MLRPRLRLAALLFLGFAPSVVACGADAKNEDTAESETVASKRLRVVAANLTSGSKQSYDPGHGLRILKALAPDVALMQELNVGDSSDGALRTFVDEAFGPEFHVFREANAIVPNGVVSRFPILEHGEWTDPGSSGTRDFAWVRLDIPGPRDLWAVSLHLKARALEAEKRVVQAKELVAKVHAFVPADAYLVIGGDLNTEVASEPCMATLGEIVSVEGPYPADAEGNINTSTNRNAQYDWVLSSPELTKLATPVKLGNATFGHGLVFDTRNYPALDQVPPAEAGDSAADGMQHMAVVRDFLLR